MNEGRGSYWSLDDESVRTAARLDPHGFVEQGGAPMAIDEVQRGGNDVVLAVTSLVDRRNDRGQFVLAGSTRFVSVPQLSESLVGVVARIRAWTPSLTSREKRHPQVVVADTGLACGLLGSNALGLGMATNPLTGPLLESFVTMELTKQRGWSQALPTLRHWRDRNGAEVDRIWALPVPVLWAD